MDGPPCPGRSPFDHHPRGALGPARDRLGHPLHQCLQNPGDAHDLWTGLRSPHQMFSSPTSMVTESAAYQYNQSAATTLGPSFDDWTTSVLLCSLRDPTRPPHAVLWAGICAIAVPAVRPPSRRRHAAAREPHSPMVAHTGHIPRTTLQTSRRCQHLAHHRPGHTPHQPPRSRVMGLSPLTTTDHLTSIEPNAPNLQPEQWAAASFSPWVALVAHQVLWRTSTGTSNRETS